MTEDEVTAPRWSRRAVLTAGLVATAAVVTGSAPLRRTSTTLVSRVYWADELCDSYAVNTKSFFARSVYRHTDAVFDLLTDLGVRTVRERVATGSSPGAQQQRAMQVRLANAGIRWHATIATLADWPRATEATDAALDVLTRYYGPKVGDLGRCCTPSAGATRSTVRWTTAGSIRSGPPMDA